jgi:hypothetical protein
MESPILMLVFGIAVGVLLTAKPVKELVTSIDEKAPAALPYVVFGFLLFTATWALQWLGFIVVVTTFGLYQVFGSSDLGDKLKTFFKFGWLKKKRVQEPAPVIQPPASRPVPNDPVMAPAYGTTPADQAPDTPIPPASLADSGKVKFDDGPDEPQLDESEAKAAEAGPH